ILAPARWTTHVSRWRLGCERRRRRRCGSARMAPSLLLPLVMNAADTIRLVLLALLGGLALPLAVQLFLTLRTLQRASLTVERRLDQTSRELHEALAGLRHESA